jgi:hypothetical protein
MALWRLGHSYITLQGTQPPLKILLTTHVSFTYDLEVGAHFSSYAGLSRLFNDLHNNAHHIRIHPLLHQPHHAAPNTALSFVYLTLEPYLNTSHFCPNFFKPITIPHFPRNLITRFSLSLLHSPPCPFPHITPSHHPIPSFFPLPLYFPYSPTFLPSFFPSFLLSFFPSFVLPFILPFILLFFSFSSLLPSFFPFHFPPHFFFSFYPSFQFSLCVARKKSSPLSCVLLTFRFLLSPFPSFLPPSPSFFLPSRKPLFSFSLHYQSSFQFHLNFLPLQIFLPPSSTALSTKSDLPLSSLLLPLSSALHAPNPHSFLLTHSSATFPVTITHHTNAHPTHVCTTTGTL